MADPNNFRIRVFYRKTGRLTLLSHLEVARALERAVRRAELPYAISQGFSPHMKIAFGSALPVGIGGTHECFDLQMTRYVAPEKVMEALITASVNDLMVSTCDYIGQKDPAASVAYPVSSYKVVLSAVPENPPVLPETIKVIRKKKEKELVVADYLINEIDIAGNIWEFKLEAKPTGSLRADKLVGHLIDSCKNDTPLNVLSIMRTNQQHL